MPKPFTEDEWNEYQEKIKKVKPFNEKEWEAFKEEVNEIKSKRHDAKMEEINYDILLVNDEPSILFLVEKILGLKGITCKLLFDGKEVLNELEHYHPKVVVLDAIMPYISGWELCKQIKSNPKLNHLPVFVFSHEWQRKYHLDCKANGYIPYPFDFSDFDAIINLLKKYNIPTGE